MPRNKSNMYHRSLYKNLIFFEFMQVFTHNLWWLLNVRAALILRAIEVPCLFPLRVLRPPPLPSLLPSSCFSLLHLLPLFCFTPAHLLLRLSDLLWENRGQNSKISLNQYFSNMTSILHKNPLWNY